MHLALLHQIHLVSLKACLIWPRLKRNSEFGVSSRGYSREKKWKRKKNQLKKKKESSEGAI
jgi:hypothetical protein